MGEKGVEERVEEVGVDEEVDGSSVGAELGESESGDEKGEDKGVNEQAGHSGGEVPEERGCAPVRGTVGAGRWKYVGEEGREFWPEEVRRGERLTPEICVDGNGQRKAGDCGGQ